MEAPSSPVPKPAGMSRKAANLSSLGMILASVLLAASGQLIFKAAVNETGKLEFTIDHLIDLATSPLLILGMAVFGASAFLWLVALMKAELSFAYPFLSISYMLVMIGGALFFNEALTAPRIIGVAVIICGLLVIARSEQTRADH